MMSMICLGVYDEQWVIHFDLHDWSIVEHPTLR